MGKAHLQLVPCPIQPFATLAPSATQSMRVHSERGEPLAVTVVEQKLICQTGGPGVPPEVKLGGEAEGQLLSSLASLRMSVGSVGAMLHDCQHCMLRTNPNVYSLVISLD